MPLKTGRPKIRNLERMGQVLELRKAGASLQQIADKLDIGSKQRVHQIVMGALRELNEKCMEGAAEIKRLELERLDGIMLSLYAQRANPRVADSILRTMERRAKLLGLDAPSLIATTAPDGSTLPHTLDLSLLSFEQLEQLESIYRTGEERETLPEPDPKSSSDA